MTSKIRTAVIQTGRGRFAMRSPSRRQGPCSASAPPVPTRGTFGQKTKRGAITSIAGSRLSIESIAMKIPIAPIGPIEAVELSSARERQSRAAITVRPEATIAGPAPRSAYRIDSDLLSRCLSSSRYRAISSRA